jgi:Rieske Fe-S protein
MGAVAVGDEPALVAGPAPINLPIPPYAFQGDTKVRIGEGATA